MSFDCMVCDFVNGLCDFEKLLQELNALVVSFAVCDYHQCTPCYTAASVPRKVRLMSLHNMINYRNAGYEGGYPYQCQDGCNCGCKN